MRLNKKLIEAYRVVSFGNVDFYKTIDCFYTIERNGKQIARCKSYSAARLVLTSVLNQ
jgi:hypothetical protein